MTSGVVIGVDAVNLRGGGGLTHIVEVLSAVDPAAHGISQVVAWGGRATLDKLPDRPWLRKETDPALDGGFVSRTAWQTFRLGPAARRAGCDVLFVPGGSYSTRFRPVVTMCRNMLPFDRQESARFGLSFRRVQFELLRRVQGRSFRKADAVIFLTEYARTEVLSQVGRVRGACRTIPHGVNERFATAARTHRPLAEYDDERPIKALYVSIINQYKHQWRVAEAFVRLREQGFPVELTLVGPAFPAALARLEETLARIDPQGRTVKYVGPAPFEELHRLYAASDMGVFASSCENMPNILMEKMAAGLPVASSDRGPMPEVLGDAGLYFDPEDPGSIARACGTILGDHLLRERLSAAAARRGAEYSWALCAERTFSLLAEVARERSAGKRR